MAESWKDVDLRTQPGHFARRMHQLAVALFAREVGELGLTPVQYSSLQTVCQHPGIDQKSLAAAIAYDTSTIGGVIDRLEARGLVARSVSPTDRRVRLVNPTPQGRKVLAAAVPRMLKTQEHLLQPLTRAQRAEFMRLMQIVIEANADLSSIPARE
jgi:DNA-binding MarR family transcriptional regulator